MPQTDSATFDDLAAVHWAAYDALLFDWDGTLADTQPVNYLALAEVLHERCGVRITWQWYASARGTRMPDRIRRWEREQGRALPVPVDELFDEVRARLAERTATVRLFEPVCAIVRQARERGVPVAVATTAERPVVTAGLAGTGLGPLFDAVVSFDDVGVGKPDPAVYLAAAMRLGVVPGRCLAFEDSSTGIRAARAAGMDVVDVRPSLVYATPPDLQP